MKKAFKILGIVFAVLFVLMIGAVVVIKSLGLPEEAPVIQINYVDINNVPDGIYKGKCDAGLVKVEVTVEVKDKKIHAITIDKHDNGLGKKAEKIVERVVKEQSLEVDVVSGATHSSKAILKAVETALTSNK